MHYLNTIKTEVDHFIDDFMGGQYGNKHNQELLRNKFHNGYCWYFANMLKLAFKRGIVCWTAPFGHFVWVDTNIDTNKFTTNNAKRSNIYDIEGRYCIKEHDAFYIIPEQYLGPYIDNFRHTTIGNKTPPANKNDLIHIVKKYCDSTGEYYDKNIEDWFID